MTIARVIANRPRNKVHVPTVTLAHGGGGKAMKDLIDDVFVEAFDNPLLAPLDDQARPELAGFARLGDRLAFTTDSFVIDPLIFPGGDIGKLAVCGTVNDLAVGGAIPLYLSCGFIIEEGVSIELLRRIARSMATAAREAGVQIVTGDTKVVERGHGDGVYISTAGVGLMREGLNVGPHRAQPGDVVLVSGSIGDHGMAIMSLREGLEFESQIRSDCAALNGLIGDVLTAVGPAVHAMRDPTRGGLASTLNEIAASSSVGVQIEESLLPVHSEVQAACELLGLDPVYVANEGKVVLFVAPEAADRALEALRAHPLGREAARIGQVTAEHPRMLVARTMLGANRVIPTQIGEQLPRIC